MTLILLAVTIQGSSLTAATAKQSSVDPAPYLHAQRMVDIGGRRLNLYCSGTGSPVVILDAGLGGTTAVWDLVQPTIARTTRVCSYDRAGMGFSDPAPATRDAAAIVTDLHALLQRAGIEPPYVLVGHSIAGLYEPLYADRYPNEVAGIVLVDPVYADQIQDLSRASPVVAKSIGRQRTYFAKCSDAATSHELTPGSMIFNACGLLDAAGLRKECDTDGFEMCKLDKVQNDQQTTAAYWRATAAEFAAMGDASAAEVKNEQRNYGNLPLIVLTRGNPDFDDPDTPISADENRALWNLMHAAHERIASTSSIGKDFVVTNSGHDIQNSHPQAVILAIDDVIDQVRRSRH